MTTTEQNPFQEWAIVELMGHRVLGGLVTEEQRFGATRLRVDLPSEGTGDPLTQYYSSRSIFGLTLTTEAVAKRVGRSYLERLVDAWTPAGRMEIRGHGQKGNQPLVLDEAAFLGES